MDLENYHLTKNQQSTSIAKADASQWEKMQKKFDKMEELVRQKIEEMTKRKDEELEQIKKRTSEEVDFVRRQRDEEFKQMKLQVERAETAAKAERVARELMMQSHKQDFCEVPANSNRTMGSNFQQDPMKQ